MTIILISNLSQNLLTKQKKLLYIKEKLTYGEDGGIRTHAPLQTYRISSATS